MLGRLQTRSHARVIVVCWCASRFQSCITNSCFRVVFVGPARARLPRCWIQLIVWRRRNAATESAEEETERFNTSLAECDHRKEVCNDVRSSALLDMKFDSEKPRPCLAYRLHSSSSGGCTFCSTRVDRRCVVFKGCLLCIYPEMRPELYR